MGKAIEEKRKIHEKKLEQCRKANDDIQANKRIVKEIFIQLLFKNVGYYKKTHIKLQIC